MNLDWIKFAVYCLGVGLLVFWMVVILLSATGCATNSESDTNADGAVCLGLCYLIRIAHDQDVETKEIDNEQ